jgi:hypothetical protein
MEYTKPEVVTSYAVTDLYTNASGFASACIGPVDGLCDTPGGPQD